MISNVIPADNARLCPSQGDKLMRLPSQTIGKEELLRSMSVAEEGPEEMMDAEDYLQPTSSAAPPPPAANGSVVGKVSIVSTVCKVKDNYQVVSGVTQNTLVSIPDMQHVSSSSKKNAKIYIFIYSPLITFIHARLSPPSFLEHIHSGNVQTI